jgi:hypothetical protein
MGAADWGIGHEVSGVTPTGEKFAGEVFTFDEGTGIAVLRTKGDIINTHDVRVLNTAGCKEVKSTAPKVAPAMDKLPVVDEARNKRREEAALKVAQASAGASTVSSRPRESIVRGPPDPPTRQKQTLFPPRVRASRFELTRVPSHPTASLSTAANIGVGVTQEAQDIFDALARTLPCVWDGKAIQVMDEVRISPPYDECEPATQAADPRAVERVQKVLAHEKSKLGLE